MFRWALPVVLVLAVGFAVARPAPDGADAVAASVSQTCSATLPGVTTITVAWAPPGGGALQTWFDISLVPGFAPGWFQGHGPLSPSQTAFALDRVPSGLVLYYRVNTLYTTGWRESASGFFVTNCGGLGGPPVPGAVSQTCDGTGRVTVTFNWQPNAPGAQFIDLSIFNNGFAPGTFVGVGPFGNGAGSFTWYGIAKGTVHFWRVNTLTSTGWRTSSTASFGSLSCQPPMKACVGYMKGYTSTGRAECDQIIAAGGDFGACIGTILHVPGYNDPGACVRLHSDERYLQDCLLGLSGQSHFGAGTSCRLYYQG